MYSDRPVSFKKLFEKTVAHSFFNKALLHVFHCCTLSAPYICCIRPGKDQLEFLPQCCVKGILLACNSWMMRVQKSGRLISLSVFGFQLRPSISIIHVTGNLVKASVA